MTSFIASEVARSAGQEWWNRCGRFVFEFPGTSRVVPVVSRGSGFMDADGREYLDLACGQLGSLLGHNHPKFIERIIEQVRRQLHTGSEMISPPIFEAAAKLSEVVPGGLQRMLLLSTGSEANEGALRIARACTGRDGVVGLAQGYYGSTQATRGLGLLADGRSMPGSHRVGSVDGLRELLRTETGRIAAMIVEPVRAAQGVVVPEAGFLRELKALLSEAGALMIVDECQTGFGRTGRWFGVDHDGVAPDILVFAKGAGGGLPVSGVLATDDVAAGAIERGLSQISSHQQEPLAAAALCAVIDIVREEGLVERAARIGSFFRQRLEMLRERYPGVIADVRGLGLLLGVEIRSPDGSASGRDALAARLHAGMMARGVRFGYGCWGGVFRLAPALTITEEEILRAVDAFESVLLEAPR